MAARATHPDLEKERARASFPVRELTYFLDGGPEKTQLKEKLIRLAKSDPLFNSGHEDYFLPRPAAFYKAIQKWRRLAHYRKLLHLDDEAYALLKSIVNGGGSGILLHDDVFIPNLKSQGDDEQRQQWVPLAEEYKIIGCYAQTELGHGSNVQRLETTATFIPETDEFELHSPTLSSTKWWPGCLGRIATHAVIYARLILHGKDYGIHAFLVPIRSLETHEPLPGITVGDIGPKFGTPMNDNGFLRLDHVRIPRRNMLMKFAKVSRDGTYHRPPHDKVAYATMMLVRITLVVGAAYALSRAITIAVRYSAIRRQFGGAASDPENPNAATLETQILDYGMQQYRLMPLLATAFALHFTARQMRALYAHLTGLIARGSGETVAAALPEIHATAAGLKALATRLAADGIEECRKACGGHGYSRFAGLADLFADYVASNTVEGDNFLMPQQTARFLLKELRRVAMGDAVMALSPSTQYLAANEAAGTHCAVSCAAEWLAPANQIAAFEHRARRVAMATAAELQRGLDARRRFDSVWSDLQPEIHRMATAHSMLYVVRATTATAAEAPAGLRPIITRLSDLFVLHAMERDLADFMEDGYVNAAQAALLRATVRQLVREVRLDAVPLVDAFAIPDISLNSALGRFDGHAYETLYEWAQKEPLNSSEVVAETARRVLPLLRGEADTEAPRMDPTALGFAAVEARKAKL